MEVGEAGTRSSRGVEKYFSCRKILCFFKTGHHNKWAQMLHPWDWMPEHYTFFPSFTSELILSHPRKMPIPWKRNHSKSTSKNTGNKGLKSLVQPYKWGSWDLTEERICLETTLLGWLACSCPARCPAPLPPYAERAKPSRCTDSQLPYTGWKKYHKQTSEISLY